MSFLDLGSNSQASGGYSNDNLLSYVKDGDSQLFGDYYTERSPRPKGKSRKSKSQISSNNSRGFGFDLQNFGDSLMLSEIGIGNSIRKENQGRKKRLEKYNEEKAEKLKSKGLQEGPTIGRKLVDKIKLAHNKRQTTNQLKKYYKPKEKTSETQSRLPEEPTLKQARNGYKGYVSRPTFFLAGEAGREFVSIKPMKRKTSRKQNNGPYDLMAGYNGIMNFRT
jgi:hypothetical protein